MQAIPPKTRRPAASSPRAIASLLSGVAIFALSAFPWACSPEDPEQGDCVTEAIAASCAFNICHGDDPVNPSLPPAAGLNLLSPTVETDMLNMPATYTDVTDPASCPNPAELLMNQANPAESLMIKKLNGTHSCGEAMPNAGVPITDAHRACLIAWAQGLATGTP